MNEVEGKKQHWTVKELAEAAKLTTARIRQLLLEGEDLRGQKFGGQGGFFVISDAEARRWLASRAVLRE